MKYRGIPPVGYQPLAAAGDFLHNTRLPGKITPFAGDGHVGGKDKTNVLQAGDISLILIHGDLARG
jgi:hypothetical protein